MFTVIDDCIAEEVAHQRQRSNAAAEKICPACIDHDLQLYMLDCCNMYMSLVDEICGDSMQYDAIKLTYMIRRDMNYDCASTDQQK
jgi:hypothetical protein